MTHNFGIPKKPRAPSTSATSGPTGATSRQPSTTISGAQTIAALPPHEQGAQQTRRSHHEKVKNREREDEPRRMLRDAIWNGDTAEIKRLLRKKVSPNAIFDGFKYNIKVIIENLESLMKHGLDLNGKNKRDETLIDAAYAEEDFKSVDVLIKNGAKFNKLDQLDESGKTMLHHACAAGDVEGVRKLIASGARVRIGNPIEAAFHADLSPEGLRDVLRELSKGERTSNWLVLGWALRLNRMDVVAWIFAENLVPCQDWLHSTAPRISTELLDAISACFITARDNNDVKAMTNCIVSMAGIVGAIRPSKERDFLHDQVAPIYKIWEEAFANSPKSKITALFAAAQEQFEKPTQYDARAYFKRLGLI